MSSTWRAPLAGTTSRTAVVPRRVTVVAAAAVVVAAGLGLGLVMPRGPMTTGQSLAAVTVAVVVGLVAGVLVRSRWAALGGPVLLAGVLELVRLGEEGPTVDALRFDSLYALMVMIAGRGFDGLVILLPMAVAALWGAALARRAARTPPVGPPDADPAVRPSGRRRTARVLPRAGLASGTAVVALLVAGLARPASTEPVVGPDGEPIAGSIAELVTLPIGGHDQGVMIRGADTDAPVLLFLEGGPGGTALGSMRYAGQGLEQSFVVATWDQRGTGRSADQRAPQSTLTVDRLVDDAIEVAEHLCDRFDEDGVYVVGSSWGSTLGVLVAQERPDLVRAYVGVGQMVSQARTDEIMYADTLAWAREAGDAAMAARLEEVGPPPYEDALTYPVMLTGDPRWQQYPTGDDHDGRAGYPQNLFVAEYSLTEQLRSAAGLADTFALLYPQLQGIDFREQVPRLDVPVHVVLGAYEAPGRADLAREWLADLDAPAVHVETWDRSGHTPHLDEPARFAAFMADVHDRSAGASPVAADR
ncbi:alpha/beta fold hydrolase [Actinotalea sp. Marseille-Q4924]|uniref:alpha/beta fold hydrolase n=1 Tax=Actinotalea sp. Marseille-Q4924 TaxID=2866571 RepID=UPI001CE49238|nr:alpha/beta hydrolase [Actinotalea sp. Marseille-Q4924]